MEREMVLVITTCGSKEEAHKIQEELLNRRLAACVNLVPAIHSRFWWNQNLESETETMLLVKTTRQRLSEIIPAIKKLHSYQVPEIIALPVITGNPEYLAWVAESTA